MLVFLCISLHCLLISGFVYNGLSQSDIYFGQESRLGLYYKLIQFCLYLAWNSIDDYECRRLVVLDFDWIYSLGEINVCTAKL